jgi:hypothetical protein
MVREHKFGIGIECNPSVGVSPLGRVVVVQVPFFRVNEAPNLISLDAASGNIANQRIKRGRGFLSCRIHQGQDGVAVNASQPLDGSDRATLQHHGESLSRFVQRRVVAIQRLDAGFYKGGLAEGATVTLYALFSDVAKPLGLAVLTFNAGHGLISACVLRKKPYNSIEVQSWASSAIGLAPQPVDAGSGALSVTGYGLWWLDTQIEGKPAANEFESDTPHFGPSFLKRSALGTRGVSYFTPKSVLFSLFSVLLSEEFFGEAARHNLRSRNESAVNGYSFAAISGLSIALDHLQFVFDSAQHRVNGDEQILRTGFVLETTGDQCISNLSGSQRSSGKAQNQSNFLSHTFWLISRNGVKLVAVNLRQISGVLNETQKHFSAFFECLQFHLGRSQSVFVFVLHTVGGYTTCA